MIVLAVAASGSAQSWTSAYDTAVAKARSGDWAGARAAFKQAAANRPEDQSGPTNLPGPATERRVWRDGKPYSPNFLAAYAGYRSALTEKDSAKQTAQLKTSAAELETLLNKKQYSAEAFYFLSIIYSSLGETAPRIALDAKLNAASGQMTWKIDSELLQPEELAQVAQLAGRDIENPGQGNPTETIPTTTNTTNPSLPSVIGSRVMTIATKFALIIGNSESRLSSVAVPFASDDAQAVREALLANAGYAEQNVDLVLNGTAAQISAAAKALADRIPEGATVFIYFSGVGVNLDGKDFLGGVDTDSPTDSSSMVAKADVFRTFMAKGARVFSFFQVNRPVVNGRYFGMEVPLVGNIAQMQSTIQGESVQSITRNGKARGLFTDALTGVMGEIRSNKIPIQEFGWQVFYRIRRGDTGSTGGGSRQTPTLPVLTNLAADAKF